MASPQTFIVTNLPGDLESWLNVTTITGSSQLALLEYWGFGPLHCQMSAFPVLPPPGRAPWQTLNKSLVSTLVWPNLYWVWSTSMEPRSFSEAFLLSMNWPSGIALALSTLYLQKKTEHRETPVTKTASLIKPHSLLTEPVSFLQTVHHFTTA